MAQPTDMRVAQNNKGVWLVQDAVSGSMMALDHNGIRVRPGDNPSEHTLNIMAWILASASACDELIRNTRPAFKA